MDALYIQRRLIDHIAGTVSPSLVGGCSPFIPWLYQTLGTNLPVPDELPDNDDKPPVPDELPDGDDKPPVPDKPLADWKPMGPEPEANVNPDNEWFGLDCPRLRQKLSRPNSFASLLEEDYDSAETGTDTGTDSRRRSSSTVTRALFVGKGRVRPKFQDLKTKLDELRKSEVRKEEGAFIVPWKEFKRSELYPWEEFSRSEIYPYEFNPAVVKEEEDKEENEEDKEEDKEERGQGGAS
ncbi:hypothetical protein V8F33_006245 [Rhypophila sp. PSN 637]